jgi:hypothetical protein
MPSLYIRMYSTIFFRVHVHVQYVGTSAAGDESACRREVHVHICIHAGMCRVWLQTLFMCVCVRVCVCVYIYIYVYVYIYICMYVCMYTYMYVCMYVCKYIYICIYIYIYINYALTSERSCRLRVAVGYIVRVCMHLFMYLYQRMC